MILLTQDFMANQLDYPVQVMNSEVLFKEYWYKICGYIREVSAYNFTEQDVEDIINYGSTYDGYTSQINSQQDREYYFKRAMGLQLIYEDKNGRNTMIKGSEEKDDICRDTIQALRMIGLLPRYRRG